MVRLSTLTSGCTTGPMPTTATLLSFSFLASSLFSSFSSAKTSESPICTAPWAICVMPWPEPPPWTVICTPGFSFMYCSAAASTRGWSAVEPTAVMLPETSLLELEDESDLDALESVSELPPQAARSRPRVAARDAPEMVTNLRRDML